MAAEAMDAEMAVEVMQAGIAVVAAVTVAVLEAA
jgi:hypothetical protein